MSQAHDKYKVLMEAALKARENAYAPYSKYKVGCAIYTEDGSLFSGANVENASYGLCSCAERNAINAAVCAGHRQLKDIVIVTQSSPPAAPCGLCRQTINEFVSKPETLNVVLINLKGEKREFSFAELFPLGFRGEEIY